MLMHINNKEKLPKSPNPPPLRKPDYSVGEAGILLVLFIVATIICILYSCGV